MREIYCRVQTRVIVSDGHYPQVFEYPDEAPRELAALKERIRHGDEENIHPRLATLLELSPAEKRVLAAARKVARFNPSDVAGEGARLRLLAAAQELR